MNRHGKDINEKKDDICTVEPREKFPPHYGFTATDEHASSARKCSFLLFSFFKIEVMIFVSEKGVYRIA